MSYELRIDQPFDLGLTLEFHQGHRWRTDGENPGWYTGVLGNDFVRIRQKGDGLIEFEPYKEEIAQKLRWQFRADESDEAVYTKLRTDPRMATLVGRYNGLRIMRVDPWECLAFFILSAHNHYQTRVPTAPTANSIDDIAKDFWEGECWSHNRYPFPSPEQVASENGLVKLQELWSKHPDTPRRISGLSEMPGRLYQAAFFVKAGQLHKLKDKSTDHAVKVMKKMLRGVGSKTAHCVALFGLGHMDAFPVDTQVTRALLSIYGRDPFRPYAGYAAQFLFMEGLRNSPSQ